MKCPNCQSENTVKNGYNRNKKPKRLCKDCKRQFVENPEKKYISQEERERVDKLLLERVSLRGICRTVCVSMPWLLQYIKKKAVRRQCDEMWSFVGSKKVKCWIKLALDISTHEVVGFHAALSRGRDGAQGLWDSLPPVYRQCALLMTDFWEAYKGVLPSKRHFAVGKESGLTNLIERFKCTLRQRCSRLVRKTLSFSVVLR